MWGVINDNWTKYRERTSPKIVAARAKSEFDEVDKRRPYIAQARKLYKLKPKSPQAVLEELEKFDGIFFATTNLTQNMDDAFNRRFLYKIEYKKPSKEIRGKIWNSKIDED